MKFNINIVTTLNNINLNNNYVKSIDDNNSKI
jgi:hypothetical protein